MHTAAKHVRLKNLFAAYDRRNADDLRAASMTKRRGKQMTRKEALAKAKKKSAALRQLAYGIVQDVECYLSRNNPRMPKSQRRNCAHARAFAMAQLANKLCNGSPREP